MDFEKDLNSLKEDVSLNKSECEIRKKYLSLLKRYHPDLVEDEDKDSYKEYTTRLLLFYEDYKNNKSQASSLNFDNSIYIKLMKIDREEYNAYKKYEVKTRWKTDEDARDFLGNAIRCYEKVIKECKDPQLIKAAKTQLEWVRPLFNLQNKELVITPAIKYPHYNYAIYGNDYLDHWQWFPLTYVYANEYNNFISKLARQLISREKINKLLPVFNFDSVESFIKKCELVEKGI